MVINGYIITGWILFGLLNAYMAKKRGKNPLLWFFLGAGFGIFGLFFLFFGPKKVKKEVETVPTVNVVPETPKEKFWYYLDENHTQFGPMSFDALEKNFTEGKIKKETFVWNEDLEDWVPFSQFMTTTSSL